MKNRIHVHFAQWWPDNSDTCKIIWLWTDNEKIASIATVHNVQNMLYISAI